MKNLLFVYVLIPSCRSLATITQQSNYELAASVKHCCDLTVYVLTQGSKGGLRLGNLCMVSDCPRAFSPQECVLLVNFAGKGCCCHCRTRLRARSRSCNLPQVGPCAELVVRVLERPRALEHRVAQADTDYFFKRRLDCFDRQAVLFVDVASLPWSVMLCNQAFTQVLPAIP